MDRALDVRSTFCPLTGLRRGYLAGAVDEAAEEENGHLLRLALLHLMAAGEVQEGAAGLRDGGEEGAELSKLGGAEAVPEGVEVAARGTGAGAAAATACGS